MQFQRSSLNINARMYLQDTPRDTMAKDPRFESLCSTSTWNDPGLMPNTSNSYIFMCFRASFSTKTFKYSFSIELLLNTIIKTPMCFRARAQDKHLINYVFQGPHPTHEIIYMLNKTYAFGLRQIYQKNHHSHVKCGLMPNLQNITSKQHHIQCDLCP